MSRRQDTAQPRIPRPGRLAFDHPGVAFPLSSLEIRVNQIYSAPSGYQWTGEYREPQIGEFYIEGMVGQVCQRHPGEPAHADANGTSRYILRQSGEELAYWDELAQRIADRIYTDADVDEYLSSWDSSFRYSGQPQEDLDEILVVTSTLHAALINVAEETAPIDSDLLAAAKSAQPVSAPPVDLRARIEQRIYSDEDADQLVRLYNEFQAAARANGAVRDKLYALNRQLHSTLEQKIGRRLCTAMCPNVAEFTVTVRGFRGDYDYPTYFCAGHAPDMTGDKAWLFEDLRPITAAESQL